MDRALSSSDHATRPFGVAPPARIAIVGDRKDTAVQVAAIATPVTPTA